MSNFSESMESFWVCLRFKSWNGREIWISLFRYFFKKISKVPPSMKVYPGEANVILYRFLVLLEKLGGVFFGVSKFLAVHLFCLTLCFGLLSILPASLCGTNHRLFHHWRMHVLGIKWTISLRKECFCPLISRFMRTVLCG